MRGRRAGETLENVGAVHTEKQLIICAFGSLACSQRPLCCPIRMQLAGSDALLADWILQVNSDFVLSFFRSKLRRTLTEERGFLIFLNNTRVNVAADLGPIYHRFRDGERRRETERDGSRRIAFFGANRRISSGILFYILEIAKPSKFTFVLAIILSKHVGGSAGIQAASPLPPSLPHTSITPSSLFKKEMFRK